MILILTDIEFDIVKVVDEAEDDVSGGIEERG